MGELFTSRYSPVYVKSAQLTRHVLLVLKHFFPKI